MANQQNNPRNPGMNPSSATTKSGQPSSQHRKDETAQPGAPERKQPSQSGDR